MMEMVDLYNENRIPLGRTAERHAPKGPGEYRVVVHVCAFDSRGRLLIQRRTEEKKLWPGRWDVSVGGGVDAGETSRQGAEREFREELGYPLDLGDLRQSVTVNFSGGFDDFFIIHKDLELSSLELQKEEVAEVRYVTEAEAEAMVADGSFPVSRWLSAVSLRHAGHLRLSHEIGRKRQRLESSFRTLFRLPKNTGDF